MKKLTLLATLFFLSACDSETATETAAVIGTGQGVDSGEINAKGNPASVVPLTGMLTIVDPDEAQSAFIEQSNVQGTFGHFSLSESGAWTYTFTALVTDYNISPEEIFSVSSKDGTEHQVKVLVKGLYQREILSGEYFHPIEIPFDVYDDSGQLVTPLYNDNSIHIFDGNGYLLDTEDYIVPINIADLFVTSNLEGMLSNLTGKNVETYNDAGIYTGSTEFDINSAVVSRRTHQFDEHGNETMSSFFDESFSTTQPESTYAYENIYVDNALTSREQEQNRYTQNDVGDIVIDLTNYRQYTIDGEITDYHSYEQYNYDENGENPYHNFSFSYDNVFNALGQKTDYFATYNDTETRDIEEAFEGSRLREQYFYNANGELDYKLKYRTSINTLYEGVHRKTEYFYDEFNRLSYIKRYYADYQEGSYGIRVFGELDLTSPSIAVFIYNDELNLAITLNFSSYDSGLLAQNQVDKVFLTHYEDIDYCDGLPASNCRIKPAGASTSTMPLL